MIARVFHVLKWTPKELGRIIDVLLEEGTIRELGIDGAKNPQLVSNRSLDQVSLGASIC